ncbi:hypothetical protein D3C78_992650 [compost metagenome]
MGAHGEMLGDLGGGQHRADGEAATQALGAGEDVRGHAVVLVGEQVAATAHAALHLVEHQQCVVLVAQLAGTFQVGLVRRQHAALALHGLQDHGAGLVGDGRLQGLQVVERHMGDAFHLRPEAVGIFRLAADGHGEQGAAVEAVGRRDDLVLVRAVDVVGITAGQFERCLVGLGAGVGEEYALGKGGIHQLPGQAQGRLVGEDVGHVPDLVGLLGERLDQRRVGMAQGVHGDAAGEVDQLATGLVPDSGTLASHRDESGGGIVGNHHLVEIGALDLRMLNGHQFLLP